jgi:prevent-host-death family protein
MSVTVGVRELRENLSHWLDRAAAGEEIVVTERGRAKARIVGTAAESTRERLARQGLLTLPTQPRRRRLPPPIPVKGGGSPVTDILLEQRKQSF